MFLFKDIKRKERNMLHQTSMHTHIPQTINDLKDTIIYDIQCTRMTLYRGPETRKAMKGLKTGKISKK